jgi:signal transduction histidine kinase
VALRGLALRLPLPVAVEAPDVRLPESTEVALYYVAAEALANIAKHAHASSIRVALSVEDDHATLLVTDDGVGGATWAGGTGLVGLTDRVVAIGGRLTLESPPGAGTTVTAVAPLR